jgi:hypothetical protein
MLQLSLNTMPLVRFIPSPTQPTTKPTIAIVSFVRSSPWAIQIGVFFYNVVVVAPPQPQPQ